MKRIAALQNTIKSTTSSLFFLAMLSGCKGQELTRLHDVATAASVSVMLVDNTAANQVTAYFGVETGVTALSVCQFTSQSSVGTCTTSSGKATTLFKTTTDRKIYQIALSVADGGIVAILPTTSQGVGNQSNVIIRTNTTTPSQTTVSATGQTTVASGEFESMGPLTDYEGSFTGGGVSSSFKIFAGPDHSKTKAAGLLIYLHGDGGQDYKNNWAGITRLGRKFNLIPMAVLAPNNGSAWYKNGKAHATFLNELIQTKIYKEYNIDKSRIYFTGMSGGPQFLTGIFIPAFGNNYQGGAVPMCGGGGPKGFGSYVTGFKPSDSFKANFKMFYYTGTADFLYDQAVDSSDHYKSLGVSVQTEWVPGVTHCNFNYETALTKLLPLVVK